MTTTVAVVGFPRCGSSMLMRMLDVGGVPPVAGSSDCGYELDDIPGFEHFPIDLLDGHAVKLLDFPLMGRLPRHVNWRFIWSDRDRTQQARSHAKFLRSVGLHVEPAAWLRIRDTYERDRDMALAHLSRLGRLLLTGFEDLLANPAAESARIARFLEPDWPFDPEAAAAVVDTTRSTDCAPGMDFELGCVHA